jgi:uncharacterized protein YecA (UPF0149 family)
MGFFEKVINYFAPGEEEVQTRDIGRNDVCWCGSGRKYKKCHLGDDERKLRAKNTVKCGKT